MAAMHTADRPRPDAVRIIVKSNHGIVWATDWAATCLAPAYIASPERSAGRADGGAHEVIPPAPHARPRRRTGDPVSLARQRPSDLRPRQQPRDLRSLPFAGRGRNATGRQNAANLRASWGSRPQLIAIAITFARRQGHDWDEESRPRRGGYGGMPRPGPALGEERSELTTLVGRTVSQGR
jgi:hypothetical protein